jgi:hypothetical protein
MVGRLKSRIVAIHPTPRIAATSEYLVKSRTSCKKCGMS